MKVVGRVKVNIEVMSVRLGESLEDDLETLLILEKNRKNSLC